MPLPRHGTLEIDEDLPFLRRSWQVERAGLALFALLVLAGFLGLFGEGALSRTSVRSGEGTLSLEYLRFARRGATTELRISLAPAGEGSARLWIGHGYLHEVEVTAITPEPQSVQSTQDGVVYDLAVGDAQQPAIVSIHVQPRGFGLFRLDIGHADGERLQLRQVVYP